MNYSLGKLITQYVAAFFLIGAGVFLIYQHHPMAGGWMTGIGLLAYWGANGRIDRK